MAKQMTEKELREYYDRTKKQQRRQTAKALILHDLAVQAGLNKQITEAMIDARVKQMEAKAVKK